MRKINKKSKNGEIKLENVIDTEIKLRYIEYSEMNCKEVIRLAITMKMARVGANLTQQEVADIMGIHVQTYMKMEKNPEEVSIKDAKRFSKIVGVPWSDIFFDKDRN